MYNFVSCISKTKLYQIYTSNAGQTEILTIDYGLIWYSNNFFLSGNLQKVIILFFISCKYWCLDIANRRHTIVPPPPQMLDQRLEWSSRFGSGPLLAVPVNLTSFSISSTYNTLPSPSSLKRWKLATKASCFLCN